MSDTIIDSPISLQEPSSNEKNPTTETTILQKVAGRLPHLSWTEVEEAMAYCVNLLFEDSHSQNHEVAQFMEECGYEIVLKMVGFIHMKNNPTCFSDLQSEWRDDKVERLSRSFHMGLSDAMRTMVRIGKVYSSEELTVWCCLMKHCEEVPDTIKYNNVWVNSIEIMLDFEQPVYRSNDNSSSVWEICCCAFFEEDGFDMLVNQLDCHAFDKLTPELAIAPDQVFHCKVARILKLFIEAGHTENRISSNIAELALEKIDIFSKAAIQWLNARLILDIPSGVTLEDLQGVWENNQGQVITITDVRCKFDDDDEAVEIQELLDDNGINFNISDSNWNVIQLQSRPNDIMWERENSTDTTRWKRLNFQAVHLDPYTDLTTPDTLFSNVQFYYCIMDIIGPTQSLNLIEQLLLSMSGLRSQQAGLQMTQKLRWHSLHVKTLIKNIFIEFMNKLQEHLKIHDEGSMRCLARWEWTSYRKILNIFQTMASFMELEDDKLKVYTVWGEIGLSCFCTNNCSLETRRIGTELMECLTSLQHPQWRTHEDFLAKAAQESITWLSTVCKPPYDWFNSFELDGPWRDRITTFLTRFCHNLTLCDRIEEAREVANIWLEVSIEHLRLDTIRQREMGFDMLRDALQKVTNMSNTTNDSVLTVALSQLLMSEPLLQTLFETLFTTKRGHPDSNLIGNYKPWIVETFYRNACYEPVGDVDITMFLVEAVVNPIPISGLVQLATDLIIDITMINVSITSLNNLCKHFKEAVTNKETCTAAYKLIFEWIDKTRHKRWVVNVQENVLDLLWHILMEMDTETDQERIVKLLDYFTSQFRNIRNIVNDINIHSETTDKQKLAREILFIYLNKCMSMIIESGNHHHLEITLKSSDDLITETHVESSSYHTNYATTNNDDKSMRQCSSLAIAVLNIALSSELPPFPPHMSFCEMLNAMNVVRTNGRGVTNNMTVEILLKELFSCCAFSDVSSLSISSRLTLIERMFELSSKIPRLRFRLSLTLSIIQSVWDHLFSSQHQNVCLSWLCKVLEPQTSEDVVSGKAFDYFLVSSSADSQQGVLEGEASRKFVLEKLYAHVEHIENIEKQVVIGTQVGDCLLKLLSWVTPDHAHNSKLCLFAGLFDLCLEKAEEVVTPLPLHLKQQVITECLREIKCKFVDDRAASNDLHQKDFKARKRTFAAVHILVTVINHASKDDAMLMLEHFPNLMTELQEVLSSYENVEDSHVVVVLEALALVSSVSMNSSLTLNIIQSVYKQLIEIHRFSCVRWICKVLRPCEWLDDSIYFKETSQVNESRKFVYDQLCCLIISSDNLDSLGNDGIELLVSLHTWMSQDKEGSSSGDETSWNQISPKFPLFALMKSPLGRAKFIVSTLPHHVKTCAVCFDSFSTNADNVPRSLMCRHLLCTLCCSKILKHNEIKCPQCKSSTRCTDVTSVPKDFTLLSLLS